MDLIYANKNRVDIGIINDYSFDLAFGSDENNFELSVYSNNNVCEEDYLLYIENTEYGGVIDSISVDTASKEVKYKGRTYHGMLEKKVICPDVGQAYYTVSGDANTIIQNIIQRVELDDFFIASDDTSINISNYSFDRYTNVYSGLKKMLSSVNYKLLFKYVDGMVVLSAKPIQEYDNEIDSDVAKLKIQQTFNPVNHLICLGRGELQDRTVKNLYCDEDGNISETQSFFGIDEITEIYDYPNAETEDELLSAGTKRLKEQNTNQVEVTLDNSVSFDIGDRMTASDIITGITVTRTINKKIVTIKKGIAKVNYKVGE